MPKTSTKDAREAAKKSLETQQGQHKQTALQTKAQTVREMLELFKPEIKKSLLRNIDPDYVISTTMTAMRQTPQLLECTPISLLAGVMQSVALGLRLDGPLGHAYLLPFKNNKRNVREAQFVTGYRGYIDMGHRSPHVKSIAAAVVREGDAFEYSRGSEDSLKHKPLNAKGKVTHAYAYAHLVKGGFIFTVLTRDEVERRRNLSPGKNSDAWKNHWDKMAMKTAIRDLAPYLPMAVGFQKAAALDEMAEAGVPQELDIGDLGQVENATWQETAKESPPQEPEPKEAGDSSQEKGELFEETRPASEVLLERVSTAKSAKELDVVMKLIERHSREKTLKPEDAAKISEAIDKKQEEFK
jgi:recombination protein RecT